VFAAAEVIVDDLLDVFVGGLHLEGAVQGLFLGGQSVAFVEDGLSLRVVIGFSEGFGFTFKVGVILEYGIGEAGFSVG
jgi:hypothetical protein